MKHRCPLFACLFILISVQAQTDQWVEFNDCSPGSKLVQDCDAYWMKKGGHGLTYFEPETGVTIDYNVANLPGLPSNYISDLEISSDGIKWLTVNDKLYKFDNGIVTLVNLIFTTDIPEIQNILIDRNDDIWFYDTFLSERKLYRYNYHTDQLSVFDAGGYFAGVTMNFMGELIFATYDDDVITVHQVINNVVVHLDQFEIENASLSFMGFFVDINGNYWLAENESYFDYPIEGYLHYYHDGILNTYTSQDFGMNNCGFSAPFVDHTGNLNVYISGYSISAKFLNVQIDFNSGNISNYSFVEDRVCWIYEDEDQNIWTRDDSTFYRLAQNGVETQFKIRVNPMTSVYHETIDFDEDGNIWLENENRILRFDGTEWTVFDQSTLPDSIGSILVIFCDTEGRTWVGGTGGLQYYIDGTWNVVDTSDLVSDNYIKDIDEDEDGNILILTKQHLIQYNGFTFTEMSTPVVFEYSYDSYDKVVSFHNTLALVAEQSIYIYKEDIWDIYSDEDSMISDHSIIEDFDIDSSGTVWLITDLTYSTMYKIVDHELIEMHDYLGMEIREILIERDKNKIWMDVYDEVAELYEYQIEDAETVTYSAANSPIGTIGRMAVDPHNGNLAVGYFTILIYNPDGVQKFTDNPPPIPNSPQAFCKAGTENEDIVVYPNPASDYIEVFFVADLNAEVDLKLFDILGREIPVEFERFISNSANRWLLNTSMLLHGCYLIAIKENDKVYAKQVIIL